MSQQSPLTFFNAHCLAVPSSLLTVHAVEDGQAEAEVIWARENSQTFLSTSQSCCSWNSQAEPQAQRDAFQGLSHDLGQLTLLVCSQAFQRHLTPVKDFPCGTDRAKELFQNNL